MTLPAGVPPAPVPPAVISRDATGYGTIRAVRIAGPLRIDGTLDESVYETVPSISDFVQQEPEAGPPATQKTEVWILFDRDHVYVTFRCFESNPERMIVTEMRRDFGVVIGTQNERVTFTFDTFYDRRNGVMFIVNPIGGRTDSQVTDRQNNFDWNPLWDYAVGRFDRGWTLEAAIPFKSLRYRPGPNQIWGVHLSRLNRWKSEISNVIPLPNSLGIQGHRTMALAATLVGLETPPVARNIEIKPYALSSLTSDLTATPRVSNHAAAAAGIDVKYGVSPNLTADFTVNTDFAQVEADEQQVNLTRFSLFFPEKREFFLENSGLFSFGGTASTAAAGSGVTPVMFYSRRIGLNQGAGNQLIEVPIVAGGRLTGRIGRYSFSAMNVQTGEEETSRSRSTNFSIMRVRRDILRRSSMGVLFTGRSVRTAGTGSNETLGVDGVFGFYDNLYINTYWARTRTDGLSGDDTSYRAQLDYTGDRYGVQAERLVVGSHFNPEVGFVRRPDIRRTFGQLRFSPRPRSFESVRKFSWTGSVEYIENGSGQVEARNWDAEFATEYESGDRFFVGYNGFYELLPRPFRIASGVTLPVAGYSFDSATIGYNLGQQRPVAGNFSVEYGTFYNGHKTTVAFRTGRVKITPQFSAEPTYAANRVELVQGSFTTHLLGSRVTYTMTPRMFTSALLQYNSNTNSVTANVRLRWEYQPGSEMFVVYSEQRDTLVPRFPTLANRAFVVKINRLFRF